MEALVVEKLSRLTLASTIAIDGIERRDMVFGVAHGKVWLLNPWVVSGSHVKIDTTAWNGFIREHSGLAIVQPEDARVLGCVLDRVAFGWVKDVECSAHPLLEPVLQEGVWTITTPDGSYWGRNRYLARADGTLVEQPEWPPR